MGHRKGVGKDTFAHLLLSKWRGRGKVYAFADALYARLEQEVPGFRGKAYYDRHPEAKEVALPDGKTPRQWLIAIGQSVCEQQPDYWCNALAERVREEVADLIIITDLRKRIEWDWLREVEIKEGIPVTRVRINSYRAGKLDALDEELLHADWDITYRNDGSISDLTKQVQDLEAFLCLRCS